MPTNDKTSKKSTRKTARQSKTKVEKQAIPGDGQETAPSGAEQSLVVQGHVRADDGTSLAGLSVLAIDQDLPSLQRDEPLGEAVTDKDGFYHIEYTADQFSRTEKGSADLQVVALNAQGQEIARSQILFNAPAEATVDLIVMDDGKGLSEFERLLAVIAPLREQVAVAALTGPDIDFLAGETGENRLYLELLVTAHSHANAVDQQVEAAPFYGLMREGLPVELLALLVQPPEVQRDALKRAIAENIIPAALGDQVEAIEEALQAQRVRAMLQPPGAEGPSNLSTILTTALPSVEQQTAFLSLYHAHQGDIEQFWDDLPKQPGFEGDGVVSQLQYALQLNVLTSGHAPLIQSLTADASLGSTRALINLDTAAWQARITATGADGIAQIPAHIKGDTDEEKVANYAGAIVETLKAAFPSAYLARAIAVAPTIDMNYVAQVVELNPDLRCNLRQPLPKELNWGQMPEEDRQKALEAIAALQAELNAFPQLEEDAVLNGQGFQNWIRAGVQTFLAQAEDFDFDNSNIDVYLEEKGHAAFGSLDKTQREKVTEQLKAFQRVYQVVPRDDSIIALMNAGLLSGMAMANVPEEVFVDTFASKVGGKLQARLIHENARDLHDRATLALGSAIQYTSEIFPRVVWEPENDDDASAAFELLAAGGGGAEHSPSRDGSKRPTLPAEVRSLYATLFGKLSLCECEHCRSVYSPAAYFVDLLHFLDRQVPSSGEDIYSFFTRPGPLDVLLARRPDLQHIALTCENTNTTLPYIDLVNEILETYIVYRSSHDTSITSDRRLHTSADLMANPQHVNADAYNRLKNAVYPMTLPFDRDLETVRTYLGHLGVSRHALITAFQPDEPPSAEAALEYLKISPQEKEILVGRRHRLEDDGPEPGRHYLGFFYGFADQLAAVSNWPVSLASVETFLDRTRLEYDELEEILKTRFINATPRLSNPRAIVIHAESDTCDLAARQLRHRDGTILNLYEWRKLWIFIRLWRKLGWSIYDVDRALTTFLPPNHVPDDEFPAKLGLAAWLKDELNLGLAETLSLCGNIDTHDIDPEKRPNDSLYARLFLNPAVRTLAGAGDPFALNNTGDELANIGNTVGRLAPAVLAALRLTAADLPYLLKLTGLAPDAPANLANLSALHRYAVLARALRISVKDLFTLRDFMGLYPFVDPATTLRFVKKARKLLRSRFSLAQMVYLYWHIEESARPVALQQEEVTARLLALRAALKQLAEDLGSADATEARLRKALGQVMDQARSDAVIQLLDRSVVYTTTLRTPPPVIPEPLHGRIAYDAASQKLTISGPMTTRERDLLLRLGGAGGFADAITDLHNQSLVFFEEARTFVQRELVQFIPRGEAVAHFIENDALDTVGRQTYMLDRLLAFLGRNLVAQNLANGLGLDTAVADCLLTAVLHSPTTPAQWIVEDFRALHVGASGTGYFTVQNWEGRLIAPATASYTFILHSSRPVRLDVNDVHGIRAASDAELRLEVTLQAGREYVLKISYPAPDDPFDARLAWESQSMPRTAVSEDYLIPANIWGNASKAFVRLHKVALLVNGFKMSPSEIKFLDANAEKYGDLNTLPTAYEAFVGTEAERLAAASRRFEKVERLLDLFAFRDSLLHPEQLMEVFAASNLDEAKERLTATTGWDRQAINEATGSPGFGDVLAFFQDEQGLIRLGERLALASRIGISPARLVSLTSAPDATQTQEVKNAVAARYKAADWLAVAKELNDPLRERQRDALVDYLLTGNRLPATVRTSMNLFEYFLIDVDMSSCLPTSRIKQAISSVQLFVQRCLMKLESEVSPALLPADQWKWMQNYRVWEANRKVFLYPENYIEPELRDGKSPFFKELENELLQNDLTEETAETAFLSYLDKLDEVARLDMRGLYWEHESELDPITGEQSPGWAPSGWDDEYWTNPELDPRERADVLHVFARTQGTPPIYYYRKFINHKQWTPWEKVQANIEGDHLIPVVYNRRLYLFWPLFREITDPNQVPPRRLEIQLAWSEHKDGKWSAKKMTAQKLTTARFVALGANSRVFFPSAEPWSSFFFDISSTDGNLVLRCFYKLNRNDQALVLVGDFSFVGCESDAVASSLNEDLDIRVRGRSSDRLATPEACFVYGQHFASGISPYRLNLTMNVELGTTSPVLRFRQLGGISDAFRMVFSHQYSPFELQAPFFYQDNEHTYFVTPEQVVEAAQQVASQGQVMLVIWSGLFLPPQNTQERALTLAPAAPSTTASDRVTWSDTEDCVGDQLAAHLTPGATPTPRTQFKLRFRTFFHPYVCDFVKRLKRRSVQGLLALDIQKLSDYTRNGTQRAGNFRNTHFKTWYNPTNFVDQDYPKEDVDFTNGAYAHYNWELFFHAPLLIADRLSKNQRFEEARQWFHYLMDPTTSSAEPTPRRYWNVLPFYNNYLAPRDQISELLYLLSYRGSDSEIRQRKEEMEAQIKAWQNDPFNPHLIARMRITAYQKTVVMKYIDNLIAWGDQLFQQDTMESINQATQIYILAYLLLGPRPKIIPPLAQPVVQTFYDLRRHLDDFSNALVAAENAVTGRRCVPSVPARPNGSAGSPSLGMMLYFCIPPNDKLLGYWDTIEDRLFKIRHCMNIEGVVRQLPLFEPPIDPALLVRARAAGLDLSRVLNDINAALPHYRFNIMLQKALELCGEVRSLGAALLSALEKRDAEALSLLRSTHEIRLLEAVKQIRTQQVEETTRTHESLQKSKETTSVRHQFYSSRGTRSQSPPLSLNSQEQLSLAKFQQANRDQETVGTWEVIAAIAHVIPNFSAPPFSVSFGGSNLGSAANAVARSYAAAVTARTYEGNRASTMGGYGRRTDEWRLQEDLAASELEQIDKQIAAAEIRLLIATKELDNHDLQIENANAMDTFMRTKFTNRELYDWMVAQTSALYFQAYQLAYNLARRAERVYQFERGLSTSSFVRFDNWDSLNKGLLAGERLALDLKRLEAAYMDQNGRDYEITKHVSLVLHDPLALIALKTTGQCEIRLPETLFDMDYPGHYMRRIKSTSLTIPAVVGPYTSVNCTLTLLSSKIRKNASRPRDYAELESGDDDRFLYNFAPLQSIATSHGQNDSGMFELNFRDERFLPFEGAGADSTWRIELPPDCNAFDLDTITDVVMRMNYTARDGGDSLRNAARTRLGLGSSRQRPDDRPTGEFQRLFSLKHEFAVEWSQFIQAPGAQQLRFNLTRERFPFQFRGRTINILKFDVFLVPGQGEGNMPNAITLTRPDRTPVTRRDGRDVLVPDWPLTPPLYDLPHATPKGNPEGTTPLFPVTENSTWSLGLVGLPEPEEGRVRVEPFSDILLVCTYRV